MRTIAIVISSVLLFAAMLTACGGSNVSSSGSAPETTGAQSPAPQTPSPSEVSPTPQASGPQIVISNFSFAVPPSVSPGQQVTIVNKDSDNHTVTADGNNAFDIRVSGGGGTETFAAPATPGAYPFHCKYHGNMHATLTVQ